MNAVLLKELRQSVRNRYVLTAYVMFIVVLLVVAAVQTSLSINRSWENPTSVFKTGRTLFMTVHGIFAALGILFIPLYVLRRIITERWGTDVDLMYATPMPPCALLTGKFGSAMALAGLFLGAALPFLALSYFVGGIDVLSIVMSVILTLEVIAIATLGAIVIAIAPMPKIVRGMMQIGFALVLGIGALLWISATAELCSSGYMNIFANKDSCIVLVECMMAGLSAAGLLYAAGLAGFRPTTVDRMRPFRILATVLFAAWWVVVIIQKPWFYAENARAIWISSLTLFAAGMLVVGMSERTAPGLYLQQRLPRSRLARALGYPFRTGQLNAVCWAVLLFVAGIALAPMTDNVHHAALWDRQHILSLNISGYALTILLIWHYYLRFKGMPAAALWWVTGIVIALATVTLGPMCVGGIEDIKYLPGYIYADEKSLPLLYFWNAIALLCLVPTFFGYPRKR